MSILPWKAIPGLLHQVGKAQSKMPTLPMPKILPLARHDVSLSTANKNALGGGNPLKP